MTLPHAPERVNGCRFCEGRTTTERPTGELRTPRPGYLDDKNGLGVDAANQNEVEEEKQGVASSLAKFQNGRSRNEEPRFAASTTVLCLQHIRL
jgi:hypothetical protein